MSIPTSRSAQATEDTKTAPILPDPVPKADTVTTRFPVKKGFTTPDQRPVVTAPLLRPLSNYLPTYRPSGLDTAGHQVPGDMSASLPAAYIPSPPVAASAMRARVASSPRTSSSI